MRIRLDESYLGWIHSGRVPVGESEVPAYVAQYLLENFAGPPFNARLVDVSAKPRAVEGQPRKRGPAARAPRRKTGNGNR